VFRHVRLVGPSLALAVSVAVAASVEAASPATGLLSHRALYRLTLADSDTGSSLTRVRGGLVLEWRAACDGWLSQQRLGFVAEATEGPGFAYDVRFSSWESLDRTQLRFNVRSFDGTTKEEEFRGSARLSAPGAEGVVNYTLPKLEEVPLPAGTIFPTEHVADLIAAAQAGEHILSRQVFDGSGEDALTRATAVIGQAKTVTTPDGGSQTAWPISLAYFPLEGDDALPQFEISFDLSQVGVMSNVQLDYGEFKLDAALEKLETLPAPDCG
jgi:hypothetical protein